MSSALRRWAFFAILLAAWAIVARAGVWDSARFPSPLTVARRLWQVLADGSLLSAIGASLRRVASGYLASLVLGVPLGIILARRKAAEDTIGSLFAGLQTLPSICWLPLAQLWFGLNERAILFVVVMGAFVSITNAVQDGVRNVSPDYARAARTMGASGASMFFSVWLPASLPAILSAAKLGWAYAWRALMAGELLFVTAGLGHLLKLGRDLADMGLVVAVMFALFGLGLFVDRVVFGALERRLRARWGLADAA